jgi:hypothetical protein
MDTSQRDKKASMGTLLGDAVERMLRLQPALPDRRTYNLTQKKANIRAVSVREGFQNMRARSDTMTQRLQHYREQHEASFRKSKTEPEPHDGPVKLILGGPAKD